MLQGYPRKRSVSFNVDSKSTRVRQEAFGRPHSVFLEVPSRPASSSPPRVTNNGKSLGAFRKALAGALSPRRPNGFSGKPPPLPSKSRNSGSTQTLWKAAGSSDSSLIAKRKEISTGSGAGLPSKLANERRRSSIDLGMVQSAKTKSEATQVSAGMRNHSRTPLSLDAGIQLHQFTFGQDNTRHPKQLPRTVRNFSRKASPAIAATSWTNFTNPVTNAWQLDHEKRGNEARRALVTYTYRPDNIALPELILCPPVSPIDETVFGSRLAASCIKVDTNTAHVYLHGPIRLLEPPWNMKKDSIASLEPFEELVTPRRPSDFAAIESVVEFFLSLVSSSGGDFDPAPILDAEFVKQHATAALH